MICLKIQFIFVLFFIVFDGYADAEDYTYYPSVDKYYKFHKTARTWYEARNVCRLEEATLALPKTIEEVNSLVDCFNTNHPAANLADSWQKYYIWLGFHDHFSENEYVSLQGESLQYYYHKWNSAQPDNANNEDCGSLHRMGNLNDLACKASIFFVCEKSGKFEHRPNQYFTNDPAYKCHKNLEMCYKLHWNPNTWPVARLVCASEGGRLAIVRNKTIEEFLVRIFNDPQNNVHYVKFPTYAFIGFHDLFELGKYVDLEDNPLTYYDYVNWAPGQPDNAFDGEHCGSINKFGQLNDLSCSTPAVYVCERSNYRQRFSHMSVNLYS